MVRLIWKKGAFSRRDVSLDAGQLAIGRSEGELKIADDPAVSGRHAVISRSSDGAWVIEDQGSTNHTYLNGKAIDAAALQSGDLINIGHQAFLFWNDEDAGAEKGLFTAWLGGPRWKIILILEGIVLVSFLAPTLWYTLTVGKSNEQMANSAVRAALGNLSQTVLERGIAGRKPGDYLTNVDKKRMPASVLDFGHVDLAGVSRPPIPFGMDIKTFMKSAKMKVGKRELRDGTFLWITKVQQGYRGFGAVWVRYSLSAVKKRMALGVTTTAVLYVVFALAIWPLTGAVVRIFEKYIRDFRLDLDAVRQKSMSRLPMHYCLDSLNELADTANRLAEGARAGATTSSQPSSGTVSSIVQSMPLPAFVFDARGKLKETNAPGAKLAPDAAAGQSLLDLTGAHPAFEAGLPVLETGGIADYAGGRVAVARIEDGQKNLYVLFILEIGS